jgi:hypothetical protein
MKCRVTTVTTVSPAAHKALLQLHLQACNSGMQRVHKLLYQ